MLIKSGVNLNKEDIAGRTPLWMSASNNVNANILINIISHSGNDVINTRDNRRDRNALQVIKIIPSE